MSDQFYEKRFREALKMIQDLQQQELEPLNDQKKKKVISPNEWFNFYCPIYISYLKIYRTVEDCFENTLHPQKRILIKQILMKLMTRFLEIKRDLISFNISTPIINSDFINFEETILELKLQPSCLEVKVPRFYNSEPEELVKNRNLLVEQLIKEYGNTNCEIEETVYKGPDELTAIQAIKEIVKMERGRQGIEMGLQKKDELLEVFKRQQRQKIIAEKGDKDDFNETDEAIIMIQKYLRGFQAKKIIQRMRKDEEKFFNLRQNFEEINGISSVVKNIQTDISKEKDLKLQSYVDRVKYLKNDILEKEGVDIRLEMLDERRKFIIGYYEEKEGKELPVDEMEFYNRLNKLPPLTQNEIEEKKKEQALKEKEQAKGDKKPNQKKENEVDIFLKEHEEKGPATSQAFSELQALINEYNVDWSNWESKNPDNLHNDLIMKNILPEIKKKIEGDVDKVMKTELESLHVKLGITQKKKPKPKKPKVVKPKKLPGEALTGNRDPKDLLPGLIEANILKLIPNVNSSEFKGNENLVRNIQESQSVEQPDPSLPQLKRTLIEQVSIPLASGINVTNTPKVYLFYGAQGTGKTMMSQIIAKETNSIFLDISPEIISELVTDKNGVSKLMYTVFKVAKEFQPAMIYIDEVEHFFPKKNVKKFKPKCTKFKKDLVEQIQKHITLEDRIGVVFLTSQPGLIALPELKKIIKKSFYFPFPDYSSRVQIFKDKFEAVSPEGNHSYIIQTLALHSEGYSHGSIKKALEIVFSKERIEKLDTILLSPEEIIVPLSKLNYTSFEDYALFKEMTNGLLELKEKKAKLEQIAKENIPVKGRKV